MNYFKNKIVWVTGASSGIGQEICKQLAEKEAIIVLSARKTETLTQIKSSLKNAENHFIIPLDLEKTETFQSAFDQILKKYGRLDILFNNGGVSQRVEAIETGIEVDRKIMEINYFGNIALSKIVLPHFQEKKSGHLVITSSIAGKFGFYLRSAYSASKHALHGYYESLTLENLKYNIDVTILCPGKINTPISTNALRGDGVKHNIMDHNQETGMSVEDCVNQIIKTVSKKKREVLIGNKEILAVYIKRFLPNLFWKIIQKQKAT